LSIYLDTSVLVAALSEEPHSEAAQALLEQDQRWILSDWAAAEFSASIRIKARRGELAEPLVPILDQAIDEIAARFGGMTTLRFSDHQTARELIVLDGRLRAPDALHLVVARRLQAAMCTFDQNLARAAEEAGLQVFSR